MCALQEPFVRQGAHRHHLANAIAAAIRPYVILLCDHLLSLLIEPLTYLILSLEYKGWSVYKTNIIRGRGAERPQGYTHVMD